MEPEEIIQQKTWEQLTNQEKIVLAELVPTPEDYNMLKKLMALAADAASSSGEVPSELRLKLENKLEAELNPKRKYRMAFYYAAASVVALFVLFILLKKQEKPESDWATLPKADPVEKPLTDTAITKEKITTAGTDVPDKPKIPDPLKIQDSGSIRKPVSIPLAVDDKQTIERTEKEYTKSISVQDLLEDDNLSSFITTVY
jgi:hypothetical protein